LAEPGIRKAIDTLKNLPPPPQYILSRSGKNNLTSFPDGKKKLLLDEPAEFQDKFNKIMSRELVVKVPVFQLEENWYSILTPGSVILIIGKRGSGKSALGYFLLEKLCDKMNCYAINLPKRVQHLLPQRIGVVPNLENAPYNSALFLDEAALQFSARTSTSGKNQKLMEIVTLARQRNQVIIFVAQDTSYLDINILRGLNILIIKEPAPLQSKLERTELKEFIKRARTGFDQIAGDRRNWAYIALSPNGYQGMLQTPKPTFFCNELSNCYVFPHQETQEKDASTLSKEEKKEKAYKWHTEEHFSLRQIASRLGVSKSTIDNYIKEEEKRKSGGDLLKSLLRKMVENDARSA